MIGLVRKDLIVLKKRFTAPQRIMVALALAAAVILAPAQTAAYAPLVLPMVGVAFLVELIRADQEGRWTLCLATLPVTNSAVVLSRYIFCALTVSGWSLMALCLTGVAALAAGVEFLPLLYLFLRGMWAAAYMAAVGVPASFLFKYETGFGVIAISAFPINFLKLLPVPAAVGLLALLIPCSYLASLFFYSRSLKNRPANYI